MHPIEHLRYLARSQGIDGESLVREAAIAIGSLPNDPAMLVIVCRRLIEKHPTSAQLWWLCSSVLVSPDPQATAWELFEQTESDDTYTMLANAVPPGAVVIVGDFTSSAEAIMTDRADVELANRSALNTGNPTGDEIVVVDAVAASTSTVLLSPDAARTLDRADDRPVWVVCPLGTRLSIAAVEQIELRSEGSVVAVPANRFAMVAVRDGAAPPSVQSLQPDGPLAPELLRRSVGP